MSGNAKLSIRLAGARQSRRSVSDWVCEANTKARNCERLKMKSPPLEQPKSSLCDGDYVMIVEEVKSTVQAR